MTRIDTKKGALNIGISITFKFVLLIGNIFARRFLIQAIGNEINGLNSLYLSIIDVLSVAELGVGTAISYCMYKPIVEGDNNKVSALYNLFTKIYLIIGVIILVSGFAVMPALPYLSKQYQAEGINLYFTFALMLVSVVLSYLFSSKTSLINAYKNNYITTIIASSGQLFQYATQIIVLLFTRSFVWFLVCRIASMILQWLFTELIARKKYGYIIKNKQFVDDITKNEVLKNAKAMFMHKIGSVLVNAADSIIISSFIGLVILGKYSNYTTIMLAMVGVITLFFSPLTSVVGHLIVQNDPQAVEKCFNFFHLFNFILGTVFFLGYYAIIDNLINLCFGKGLLLSKAVSFVITINYFIQFMRQAALLFRDATGTFYYDRWKPLCEGIVNVVLSILFVCVFPDEYKVVGVIVATIITNLFICHSVEPHVLYKYAFHSRVRSYYIRNYIYMGIFIALLIAMHFVMISNENQWVELFANGAISLAFSFILCAIAILGNKEFRQFIKRNIVHIKNHKTNEQLIESKKSDDDTSLF